MSKNSSKAPPLRHPSDGAPVPSELSPALRGGGGGGGGGGRETSEEVLVFNLERVETSVLGRIRAGFPIKFVEESKADLAAIHDGETVGYVPRRHTASVKRLMREGYSAEVLSLSHDSVEVRVTA